MNSKESTLSDPSRNIYIDQSWKKQLPEISVPFENVHKFAWCIAKFPWRHHANSPYLYMICKNHMICASLYIMRLFKRNWKEISAQFTESGQLWVSALFSEFSNKIFSWAFSCTWENQDYSRIFSSANNSQCTVSHEKWTTYMYIGILYVT